MNIPELKSYESKAVDTVVYVINKAKEKMGIHLSLKELANSRRHLTPDVKVSCYSLQPPFGITGQTFIAEVIERNWRLCDTFLYVVNYVGYSRDNAASYYYFEAIFSQPSEMYPIPQVTVSVFFRIEDKHIDPGAGSSVASSAGSSTALNDARPHAATPNIFYRIEGHHSEYDIRYVNLAADWILACMQMKLNVFQATEELAIF